MINVAREPLTIVGYQQITSFNGAAVKLSVPKGTTHIFWQAEADNFRYRDDGTVPTATVGMLILPAYGPLHYPGDPESASQKLRVIATDAGSILNVTYYKG